MAKGKREYPPFDFATHLTTYILQYKMERWSLREWNQRFYDWAQQDDAPKVIRDLRWEWHHSHPYSLDLTTQLRFMSACARQAGKLGEEDLDEVEVA